MNWLVKHKLAAFVAGLIAFLLWRKAKAATPPAVSGVVTSGSAGIIIDTNVLSPTFGEPIQ